MKKILICIVAAMFATMTFAQHVSAPQHRQREFNPEEMAQRQTMRLHQALQLDSIQLQAVFLINYADALTMQDSMNVRRERMEKMRAEGKKPERVQPSEEQMKALASINRIKDTWKDGHKRREALKRLKFVRERLKNPKAKAERMDFVINDNISYTANKKLEEKR